jgi:hypothetical protein
MTPKQYEKWLLSEIRYRESTIEVNRKDPDIDRDEYNRSIAIMRSLLHCYGMLLNGKWEPGDDEAICRMDLIPYPCYMREDGNIC